MWLLGVVARGPSSPVRRLGQLQMKWDGDHWSPTSGWVVRGRRGSGFGGALIGESIQHLLAGEISIHPGKL